jgi:TolB-like protein/Tfp pilus assembly protein PilF
VWFDTFFTTLVLIGIAPALVLAWAFEMTPEGVRRTESVSEEESIAHITGRRLDLAIIAGLILVAILILATSGRGKTPPTDTPLERAEVKNKSGEDRIEPSFSALDADTISTSDQRSIAVLAFEDITQNRDQDYFARGISEELLNSLSSIPGLRVASRTSAFAFSDRDPRPTISEIASALDVAHILEGSIRKSGQTLRITAQLIDTQTDGQIWSDTYDRPLSAENLFEVQDDIADAIVGELRARLELTGSPSLILQRPVDLETYEIYLRARELQSKRLPETLRAAEADFKQVIAADPRFAPAHSGLADTYLLMAEYGGLTVAESSALARPEVEAALTLAPQSAEALTSSAMLSLRENEIETARDSAQAAITANPNYALAYHRLGMAENQLGNYEAGLAAFEQARARDPLSAAILGNIAYLHLLLDAPEKAAEVIDDIIRWNPDAATGYALKAGLALDDGDIITAHDLFLKAQSRNPEAANVKVGLIDIYVRVGLANRAAAIDDSAFNQARTALLAGDKERASSLVDAIPSDSARARIYYDLDDLTAAAPLYLAYLESVSEGRLTLSAERAMGSLQMVDSLNKAGLAPERVTRLKADVNALFEDKTPRDYEDFDALLGGAAVSVLGNNPEEALPWIERIVALRLPTDALSSPLFKPLRSSPDFIQFSKDMDALRSEIAGQITAQIEGPD